LTNNGIIHKATRHSVDAALEKLLSTLKAKGVTVFAVVDHSGEAAKVGMEMHPTKLVIFGNPKGGTPLMLAAPSIAIDLPLKILIWEDAQGKNWVSYNSSEYLAERHNLPHEFLANIAIVEALAAAVAD
jgi:uncharacterized protein (DUF302 family)